MQVWEKINRGTVTLNVVKDISGIFNYMGSSAETVVFQVYEIF